MVCASPVVGDVNNTFVEARSGCASDLPSETAVPDDVVDALAPDMAGVELSAPSNALSEEDVHGCRLVGPPMPELLVVVVASILVSVVLSVVIDCEISAVVGVCELFTDTVGESLAAVSTSFGVLVVLNSSFHPVKVANESLLGAADVADSFVV